METNEIKNAQHFLINKSLAKQMVAGIDERDKVIEIGAGKGFIQKKQPKPDASSLLWR